jgi:hypothetical protein
MFAFRIGQDRLYLERRLRFWIFLVPGLQLGIIAMDISLASRDRERRERLSYVLI